MANVEGIITFRGGAEYWRPATHTIKATYIKGIGRKRWGLIDPPSIANKPVDLLDNDFPVTPLGSNCRKGSGWWTCSISSMPHEVPAKDIYEWCTAILGMTSPEPKIIYVEKVVERVIEKGYITTIERHEALSFALTRELRFTQSELESAYHAGEADYAHRLAHRLNVIRDVMNDLGATEMFGSPTWMIPYLLGNEGERDEDAQMEMFDAVRR